MNRRHFLLGLGSVAIGAGTISGSGGYSNVQAGRGVSISTAGDLNGLLGLNDVSSGTELSDTDDTAAVYELIDNLGNLSTSDFDVDVVELSGPSGTVHDPPVEATVSGSYGGADEYVVTIQCSTADDTLGDSYQVVLDVTAGVDDVSIAATRTTGNSVPISCTAPTTVIDDDRSGDVETEGDVEVGTGVEVDGNVDAGGSVDLDNNSEVTGTVSSGGDTSVGNNGTISGGIEAGGSVTVENNGDIGEICAVGDVSIANNGSISGHVKSKSGDITISNNGSVAGDVVANGTVSLSNNVSVAGSVQEYVDTVQC